MASHGEARWQEPTKPKFLIRPAGTPPRRFSGSTISRGRKSAFHMRSIFCLPIGQISLRGLAVLRSGMPLCAVKDCRNDTKNGKFCGKTNVDSARKRLHPAKNVCFSNITVSNLCHCEEHSDVAILKPKVWHPMARHGGRNRQNPNF